MFSLPTQTPPTMSLSPSTQPFAAPGPIAAATVLVVSLMLTACAPLYGASQSAPVAAPLIDNPKVPGSAQTAVISAGCFWGVQGVFEHVRGVQRAVSGYSGGSQRTADYETVSSGKTGHAESVMITFDPAQISYGQILQIAFSVVHDPTELNRQGPDVGTQYRSAIFYADPEQRRIAESYIAQLNQAHAFPRPIVTQVAPLAGFYPAEGYHQDYLINHPSAPYIAFNDLPKVDEFKREFPALYSAQPVLAASR
jgi:peptide-methionine (S)-S-oxide reductase